MNDLLIIFNWQSYKNTCVGGYVDNYYSPILIKILDYKEIEIDG